MQKNFIQRALVLILILAAVAFLFLYKGQATQPVTTTEQSPDYIGPSYVVERVVPEDMHEYRSTAYNFSLFYPKELTVDERDEGSGASTITFQSVEKAEGFQIFIVPYSEAQVSEERFKQDIPSGIRESLSNITVDGATAAAFYSTNAALGATREVWFVHNGFLYEVTTLKPLDVWLGAIIKSWKFI